MYYGVGNFRNRVTSHPKSFLPSLPWPAVVSSPGVVALHVRTLLETIAIASHYTYLTTRIGNGKASIYVDVKCRRSHGLALVSQAEHHILVDSHTCLIARCFDREVNLEFVIVCAKTC